MNFLNSSFRIGRWFDVDVRVHILFLVWWAFQLIDAKGDFDWVLLIGSLLFVSVLIHEFGHCFGARSVGGSAHNILMWPLGGLAFADAPMTAWAQFVTVACGPLVNVVFCIVSGVVLVAATGTLAVIPLAPFSGFIWDPTDWLTYVHVFFKLNYALLLFNLLPIYPMDGGQLFQCLLWPFLGLHRATDVTCKVGVGGGIVLAAWGLMDGASTRVAIGILGVMTCVQRLQMLRYGLIREDANLGYDFSRGHTSFEESAQRMERGGSGGFWSRLFRRRRRPAASPPVARPSPNPNPGGWERKLDEEERLEREVDRILAKVHTEGMHTLTYVEKQTLERATRVRRQREDRIERSTRS